MKRVYVVCLFLFLTTTFLLSQSNPVPLINPSARVAPPGVVSSIGVSQADPKAKARVLDSYGKLPLSFEANHGQADGQVKFLSRTGGYTLFLTGDEAVLALRGSAAKRPAPKGASGFGGATVSLKRYPDTNPSPDMNSNPDANPNPAAPQSMTGGVLRMRLRDANPAAKVSGLDELAGTSNYFIGNDPAKWRTNVPTYAKVKYEGIYSGIDLVYYGNQRELEYDFVLQPGANPGAIRLGIDGASKLRLDRGDLVLSSPGGDVRLRRPYSYQEVNGTKREIRSYYVMNKKNEVGFRVASYDRDSPLIIDPVLAYSTYLGGSADDEALAIVADSAGNAYVTGGTASIDFPTANAFQPAYGGGNADAFVTKINADGTALVYSTYLGGSSDDLGQSIAVDSAGSVYLTGYTGSPDFPTVKPIQPTNHGYHDAFVTKISPDGSALVYSTYLGGSSDDYGWGIAVDSAGNAHVTGDTPSSDFPVVNAIRPTHQGYFNTFVSEINAAGTALIYSTYWGGSVSEGGSRVAVDSAGNTYIGGYTSSPDFPTKNAIQPTYGGNTDAYLSKLSPDGQTVIYSTFLGGSGGEYGWDVAVDPAGNAYVTGFTESTDFPTAHALQPTNHGGRDAFVAKINASGSALVYSTYLGGSNTDQGTSIAADSSGNAYVGGYTKSIDFPTANAIQPTNHGGFDAFVAKISGDGSALLYSTYLGGKANESIFDADGYRDLGIAVDSAGSAYVAGTTKSINFPKTLLAFQQSLKGGADAFLAKIASQTFVSVSPLKLTYATQVIGTTSAGKKLTLTNNGSSTLTINKIYVAGVNAVDFAETNNCPGMLAAGGTCTIRVTFTPTAKDKRKGVLAISDSDPTRLQAVALIGTGTVVNLFPKTLRFGNQAVGTASAPKTVTLTNTGSATLNFTGITIAGKDVGDFARTTTCGTSIGGGASCTITVTFKPTATGTRTAAVSISDDGGGSPQIVRLNGTGT